MDSHARRVLEVDTVLLGCSRYAYFQSSQARLSGTDPEVYFESAEELGQLENQRIAVAIGTLMRRTNSYEMPLIEPLDDLFDRVLVDQYVCDPEELVCAMTLLDTYRSCVKAWRDLLYPESDILGSVSSADVDQQVTLRLKELVDSCVGVESIHATFHRMLELDGTLRFENIPQLREARKRISKAMGDLGADAQAFIRRNAELFSADVPTIREGRTVVPLKSEHRSRIQGIVHQVSSTGGTIFVEPMELLEKNNAHKEAELEFERQIKVVYRDLSRAFATVAPGLRESLETLARLEPHWIRGRFAFEYDAQTVERGPTLNFIDARHPLVGRKVVPVSICIPDAASLVVISGPNTGGKTVTLKTIGLFVLLNRLGFPLPLKTGSCVPAFRRVWADIGDEQSILENTSTFSGHLRRIAQMSGDLAADDLVLLDELGSGTDPQEGGALAMALCETLLARKCLTVITSHVSSLKILASTSKGALNAAMEFSEVEKKPTYRLVFGNPGSSRALEIAAREGLAPSLLQRAKDILVQQRTSLDNLYQELTEKKALLEEKEALLGSRAAELDAISTKLAAEREAIAQQAQSVADRELLLEAKTLRDARSEVEAILRDAHRLHESLGEDAKRHHSAESARIRAELKAMSDAHDAARTQLEAEKLRQFSGLSLELGEWVRVKGARIEGVLQRALKNNEWEVLVKGKRMQFRSDALERIPNPPREKIRAATAIVSASASAPIVLDVRGMRAQEALTELRKYLDRALLSGLPFFSLIHGKGEGILQKTLHDELKQTPAVKNFGFALPEDGGSGKTVVWLS